MQWSLFGRHIPCPEYYSGDNFGDVGLILNWTTLFFLRLSHFVELYLTQGFCEFCPLTYSGAGKPLYATLIESKLEWVKKGGIESESECSSESKGEQRSGT